MRGESGGMTVQLMGIASSTAKDILKQCNGFSSCLSEKVSDVVLMGVYILTFNRNRSRDTRYECGPDVKI